MIKARTMSKANTTVASGSSACGDTEELETSWVNCGRERVKPHHRAYEQKRVEVNHWYLLCLCESTSWTQSELKHTMCDSENNNRGQQQMGYIAETCCFAMYENGN